MVDFLMMFSLCICVLSGVTLLIVHIGSKKKQKKEEAEEKTGCTVQLKKDQLLGTNCDYYLVQEGVGLKKGSYGMSIAMPDTPLIYTSPLRYENAKKLYHILYLFNFFLINNKKERF